MLELRHIYEDNLNRTVNSTHPPPVAIACRRTGQSIQLRVLGNVVEGVLADIDDDGAAVVETTSGERRHVSIDDYFGGGGAGRE